MTDDQVSIWLNRIAELGSRFSEEIDDGFPLGTRDEIAVLFTELADSHESLTVAQRQLVLNALHQSEGEDGCGGILYGGSDETCDVTTAEGFRRFLILLVVHDQGTDPRMEAMSLDAGCKEALAAGIKINQT